MVIEFDTGKDAFNRAKHGLSLAEARTLDWSSLVAIADERMDYGETRFIGYALKGNRLYCVVFTDRGTTRRIISLRKANAREVHRYAKTKD